VTVYTSDIESEKRRVPWWVVLLTGITALILGFLLLTSPGMTTLALIQFLGVYWFISGIFSIVEIFINSHNWGWKLVLGIIGILAGITILRHPVTSAIFIPSLIVIFVAIEGIIFGFVSVVRAFTEHSWGMGVLGVLSVVFGFMILFSPQVATLALPFVIGILAIVGGIVAIVDSFRVRAAERAPMPSRPTPTYSQQIPVTGPDDEPVTGPDNEPGPKQE